MEIASIIVFYDWRFSYLAQHSLDRSNRLPLTALLTYYPGHLPSRYSGNCCLAMQLNHDGVWPERGLASGTGHLVPTSRRFGWCAPSSCLVLPAFSWSIVVLSKRHPNSGLAQVYSVGRLVTLFWWKHEMELSCHVYCVRVNCSAHGGLCCY